MKPDVRRARLEESWTTARLCSSESFILESAFSVASRASVICSALLEALRVRPSASDWLVVRMSGGFGGGGAAIAANKSAIAERRSARRRRGERPTLSSATARSPCSRHSDRVSPPQ